LLSLTFLGNGNSLFKEYQGFAVGEMAYQFKSIVFPEDLGTISSNPDTQWFCNSSPSGSNILLCLPWVLRAYGAQTCMQAKHPYIGRERMMGV